MASDPEDLDECEISEIDAPGAALVPVDPDEEEATAVQEPGDEETTAVKDPELDDAGIAAILEEDDDDPDEEVTAVKDPLDRIAEITAPEMVVEDRRAQERVEAVLQVSYESMDELLVAYTSDISHGGLFVETDNFLAAGAVVKLEIQLPEEGPTMALIARVAYVRDDDQARGMGMEFLHTGGAPVTEQLASYLALSLSEDAGDEQAVPARILIVDDDKSYRDKAAMVMRRLGHKVVMAEHGLQALGAVLRDPPDLVLSDVQMPTMDGWQFLRIIRGRPSIAHIPIIFLTTLSSEDERLKGYRLGVDDYIEKPFLFEELSLRVTRVLARSKDRGASTVSKNALRGDIGQVGLPSLLQFVEIERRTGLLLVVSGQDMATLHVKDGRIVGVDMGDGPVTDDAVDRLFEVMSWTEGRFELTAAEITVKDTLDKSISYLLLEHARRQDETGAR